MVFQAVISFKTDQFTQTIESEILIDFLSAPKFDLFFFQ